MLLSFSQLIAQSSSLTREHSQRIRAFSRRFNVKITNMLCFWGMFRLRNPDSNENISRCVFTQRWVSRFVDLLQNDIGGTVISLQTVEEGPVFSMAVDTYTMDRPRTVLCGTASKDVVSWEAPAPKIVPRSQVCTGSFTAETSVRSLRKLYIFVIHVNVFWNKVSGKKNTKQKHCRNSLSVLRGKHVRLPVYNTWPQRLPLMLWLSCWPGVLCSSDDLHPAPTGMGEQYSKIE